jgi:nicotinamidase-related amidase
MQNDVVEKQPLFSEIIPNVREVLEKFRSESRPVFHIGFKVVEGTPGAEIVEPLKPIEGEYVIIKRRWSGFFQTELLLLLNRLNVKTVALTGVQTPNCVRTTAYDAIAYDFDTIIIKDCSAAATPEVHKHNLKDMENIGCRILMKEEFFKLLK